VRLTVEDDGAGFDPQASAAHHGLGLASITERVRMMKGRLCIDAAPGRGVRIAIDIPCTESSGAATQPAPFASASQAAR
jgi:two-component system NarL family sensor kinase